MILLPEQIEDLLELLEKNYIAFIGQKVGSNILSRRDKAILKDWGIDWKDFPKDGDVDLMFKLGILSDVLGDDETKKMTYEQLQDFVASGKFIPLTTADKLSLSFLKKRMYNDIKNLGRKIAGVLENQMLETVKKRRQIYEKIIKQEAKKVIIDKTSLNSMKSEIGEKTGDWARDLDRVVDTVMHETFNTGRVQSIRKKHGDEAKVWMQVYEGACKYCVGFYLSDGLGSEPKLFKISDLLAHGTNFGRKQKDWRVVLPPMHPYCRCQSYHYNEGYVWDEEKQFFVPPKAETKRRSRVKVTIEE